MLPTTPIEFPHKVASETHLLDSEYRLVAITKLDFSFDNVIVFRGKYYQYHDSADDVDLYHETTSKTLTDDDMSEILTYSEQVIDNADGDVDRPSTTPHHSV